MHRIGIDARLTYYRQGGISQMIYHLIEEMPHVDPHNRYVLLQSRKDERNLAVGANQRRARCWTPAHHRFERLALAVETLPQRLDLLHSTDFIPPLALGPFSPRSVITIHDLTFLHYPQFLTEESRRYYNAQIEAAVRRADHIITDSEATRQDVITMLNVPPQTITTVWLGLDSHFQPVEDPTPVLADYHLTEGYILFVGTFEPRKNLEGLLRAYRLLRAADPHSPALVIVGRRGWLADDIHQLSEDLELAAYIRWVEDAPYAHLPALYSGARLLCLPSFYEGFGFTPLEAMACGTPVVIADRASLPEVVGEAGLQVDPNSPEAIAEALHRLSTDDRLAAELRQAGLKRVKRFNWRETARRVFDIYQTVLEA
jgi:glycosyltransferase involved in cell wall biosynthesis